MCQIQWERIRSYKPEAATSEIGLFCSWAIKPIMLNMTNPANTEVPLLTQEIIRASLLSGWRRGRRTHRTRMKTGARSRRTQGSRGVEEGREKLIRWVMMKLVALGLQRRSAQIASIITYEHYYGIYCNFLERSMRQDPIRKKKIFVCRHRSKPI